MQLPKRPTRPKQFALEATVKVDDGYWFTRGLHLSAMPNINFVPICVLSFQVEVSIERRVADNSLDLNMFVSRVVIQNKIIFRAFGPKTIQRSNPLTELAFEPHVISNVL